MSSLSDCPPEIIEVVIDFLQHDLSALRACSQTCVALLSLCRRYIFRSLLISNSPSLPYYDRWRSSTITQVRPKIWRFLDANPTISEYVHKITYHMSKVDLEDGDVPRVLDQLHNHNAHSFQLIGASLPSRMKWAQFPPRLGDALLRVVQSSSITCLAFSEIAFPIVALRACVNLTELTISMVDFNVSAVDEQRSLTSTSSFDVRIPQLQTFACEMYSDQYARCLLNARHPSDCWVLGFSNVRMLSLEVDRNSDLAVPRAFINVTNKLETLQYAVCDSTGAPFAGMAASINNPSLSTLKRLHFSFVFGDLKDPLYGLCKELNLLSGYANVIEEISIAARVQIYAEDDIDSQQWGMLDTALSKGNGFPMLRQVSIDIKLTLNAHDGEGALIYERELDEIPTRYLPWLSSMKTVLFCFSTRVHISRF